MRASHFVYIVVAFTTFAATDLLFNRDNALAAFNQATQLNPKMAKAYVVRGDVSRLKGNLAEAFPDYDRAIQLNPKMAEAYVGRGAVYFLKGDLDNALADFNQAIQLNPKMAEANVVRGDISRLKGMTLFVKKLLYKPMCSGEGRKIWQNRISSWSHL